MKCRYIVIIAITVVLMAAVLIFAYERAHVSFHEVENGTAVSIIGGADGPTSVFIAGKKGEPNDDSENTQKETDKMQIEIQIGDRSMTALLEENEATAGLVELLKDGEITMSASNYGGFEKVCSIGQSIARADKQITTKPGDIMLYSGNQLVIFYDSNSWAYTPIGHIDASKEELETFLSGDEDEVVVRLITD